MKNLTVWIVAGCLVVGAAMPAGAQTARGGDSRRAGAYEKALKCAVVAGNASNVMEKASDPRAAGAFEAKSERAYEAARILGKASGYTQGQIDADADAIMGEELALLRDPAYLRAAIAQCKAYGFM